MAEIQLTVRGKAYGGWKSMRVQRGMEQLCGGFELGISELWPGQTESERDRRVIVPGDACVLSLDGAPVVTGYVDELNVAHGPKRHEITVSGRDRAADLVDCSAVSGGGMSGQYRGLKIERIAADLARPFGLSVIAEVDTGAALTTFALQEGETVFEALTRMARIKALMVTSDARGNVVITRAGVRAAPTELVLGQNILEASGSLSLRDRYSDYVKKSQASAGGYWDTERGAPKLATQAKAIAVDAEVPRYRPLVIVHDAPDVAASLQTQVNWERNVRAARGTAVTVKVQGWTHASGLWEPNTRVMVRDELLRVNAELLIRTVTYTLDDSGTFTHLAMTRADAFSLLPTVPVAPGKTFSWDKAPAGASR